MFGSSSPKKILWRFVLSIWVLVINAGGSWMIHLDLRKGQWTLSTPECVKGNWFGLVQVKKVARHTWNVETSGTPKAGFRLVQGCSGLFQVPVCVRLQVAFANQSCLEFRWGWHTDGINSELSIHAITTPPPQASILTITFHIVGRRHFSVPSKKTANVFHQQELEGRPTTKAIRAVGGVSLGTMFQCRLVVMKIIPTFLEGTVSELLQIKK